MSSPLGNLPDITGPVRAAFESLFDDIDPERSPLAYGIKAEGPGILKAIGGAVHAIAELEIRLAELEAAKG